MDELYQRVNKAERDIAKVKSYEARRDLQVMLNTVQKSLGEMSKESVECRRLQKPTQKFLDLHKKTIELLDSLEQHLLLAILMY
jgi:hypothetical protein